MLGTKLRRTGGGGASSTSMEVMGAMATQNL